MSAKLGSIQDFYQWVKTRDADAVYDYYDPDNCANAQYHFHRGLAYDIDSGDLSPMERAAMQIKQRQLYGTEPSRLTFAGLRKEIEDYFL